MHVKSAEMFKSTPQLAATFIFVQTLFVQVSGHYVSLVVMRLVLQRNNVCGFERALSAF